MYCYDGYGYGLEVFVFTYRDCTNLMLTFDIHHLTCYKYSPHCCHISLIKIYSRLSLLNPLTTGSLHYQSINGDKRQQIPVCLIIYITSLPFPTLLQWTVKQYSYIYPCWIVLLIATHHTLYIFIKFPLPQAQGSFPDVLTDGYHSTSY